MYKQHKVAAIVKRIMIQALTEMLHKRYNKKTQILTCNVPPPPVLPQSSDTLTIVHGSDAFQ